MDEKIKRIYYQKKATREQTITKSIFEFMKEIIENTSVVSFVYIVLVLFETIQILSMLFLYDWNGAVKITSNSLEGQLKAILKYVHFSQFFNSSNTTYATYMTLSYISISCELITFTIIILSLFYKNLVLRKYLIKLISGLFMAEMFVLLPIQLTLSFPLFLCEDKLSSDKYQVMNSYLVSFPSQLCSDTGRIPLLSLHILAVILKIPKNYMILNFYNDYSLFKQRLPWSSPYSGIPVVITLLKVYLTLSLSFWESSTMVNCILLYIMALYIIVSRLKCPFYFHERLNKLRIICEGCFICFMVTYPLYRFSGIPGSITFIFAFLFSIICGVVYSYLVTLYESRRLNHFFAEIEYMSSHGEGIKLDKEDNMGNDFINNEWEVDKRKKKMDKLNFSEYEVYIFLLRICHIIFYSANNQIFSSVIFNYYTQHRKFCIDFHCPCYHVEDIIHQKEIKIHFRDLSAQVERVKQEDLLNDTIINNEKAVMVEKRKNSNSDFHLTVWGYIILHTFDYLNVQNIVKIEYSKFLSFYLYKYIRSFNESAYVHQERLSMVYKFIHFLSKEDLLINGRKLLESEDEVQFVKVLTYNRYYEKFLSLLHETIKISLDFWEELKKPVFKPKEVERRGFIITKNSHKIERLSQKISTINSCDLRVSKLHGVFMCKVLKLEDEAQALIYKAYSEIAAKSKLAILDENPLENVGGEDENGEKKKKSDLLQNLESGVVIADGDKDNIGIIKYINSSFLTNFEYIRNEIIGKNVATLTPNNIALYHNDFIKLFYAKSKIKVLNKRRQLMAINKHQYLMPVKILIRILPYIEEGVNFICFFNHLKSFIETSRSRRQNNIKLGYIMTNERGELIHYNKICEEKFRLSKKYLFTSHKDDSEIFKIHMMFPELLNEQKKLEVNHEETPLFFNPNGLSQVKKLNSAKETVVGDSIELDQVNDLHNSRFHKRKSNVKTFKKNTIGKMEMETAQQPLQSYFVSMGYYVYFYEKIKFYVYQIVIEEKTPEFTIIARIEKKEEQEPNYNDTASMSSISHTTANTSAINNILMLVKKTTFDQSSPSILSFITMVIIIKVIFLIIVDIVEYSLITHSTTYLTNLFNLVSSVVNQQFTINLLRESIISYSLVKTGVIPSSGVVSFNNTSLGQFYLNDAENHMQELNQYNSQVMQNANFSNSLYTTLGQDSLQLNEYINENYYITKQFSLANGIIQLINTANNMLSVLQNDTGQITARNVIFGADNSLGYSDANSTDVTQAFILNYKFIFDNWRQNYLPYYQNFTNLLFINLSDTLDGMQKSFIYCFIISLVFAFLFFTTYFISYMKFTNLRVNIMILLAELSYETIESCHSDSEEMKANVGRILNDDGFFLSVYYLKEKTVLKNRTKDFSIESPGKSVLINSAEKPSGVTVAYVEEETPGGMSPISPRRISHKPSGSANQMGNLNVNSTIKQIYYKKPKEEVISITKEVDEENKKKMNESIASSNAGFLNPHQNNPQLSMMSANSRSAFNNANHMKTRSPSKISLRSKKDLEFLSLIPDKQRNSRSPDNGKLMSKNTVPVNTTPEIAKEEDQNIAHYFNNWIHSPKFKKENSKSEQAKKIESYKRKKYFNPRIFLTSFVFIFTYVFFFYFLNSEIDVFKALLGNTSIVFSFRFSLEDFLSYLRDNLIKYDLGSKDSLNILIQDFNITKSVNYQSDIFFRNYGTYYTNLVYLADTLNNIDPLTDRTLCQYLYQNTNYISKTSVLDYCEAGFFKNGLDLGVKDSTNYGIRLLDEFLANKNITDPEVREKYLSESNLRTFFDSSPFIFEFCLATITEQYLTGTKSNLLNISGFLILQIIISVIVSIVIIFIYFTNTKTSYLNKYINNKAIVLLIPRSVFINKSSSLYQKLLRNS